MTNLIGITGKLNSGKDTVAQMIKEVSGVEYETKRYADPLKDMVCTLLGVNRETLEDRTFKETVVPWLGKTPRYLMQTMGTEWGRNLVNDEIWLSAMFKDYSAETNWVVPDVRFVNEADSIRKRGGIIIEVRRDENETSSHASETEMTKINPDFVIDNNGSLKDLRKEVSAIWNPPLTIQHGDFLFTTGVTTLRVFVTHTTNDNSNNCNLIGVYSGRMLAVNIPLQDVISYLKKTICSTYGEGSKIRIEQKTIGDLI